MRGGRSLAGVLAAVAVSAMVPVAAAVGPEPPDGLISGRPHILRLRPELATVPPERGRVPRRDQPTAAAAVASCDPARLDAVARIATTARAADAADACVVLPVDGAARRVFLGAAQLTGSGITDVHAKRKPRGDEIVLRLTTRGAEVPPVQWRVDLDGRVVGTVVRSGTGGLAPAADQPPASRLTITGPKIDGDRARTIADAIDQARGEQLIDLARRATMTRRARELLAAATAHVDDKPEFLDDCPSPETPGTLVLGCYDGRIFVLRVDRADLAPVMTVTAAHELLHAAYDDMSRTERRRVADELDAFMATTGDARIEELLAEYDKVQPGTRDNELHSLVGTQVRDLPAPLERHYRRYFADRSAVVDAFDAYQHVFDDLQARYDQLEVEVRSLEGELNGLQADARAAGDEADRLTSEIDSLRGQGRIDESNQLVEPQNAAVNRYNGLIGTFNARVDEYNTKVQELNALSITLENTYNEISPIAAQS